MTGYPRDLVGYADQPPDPRWPGGARLAVNFVVNYEEGGERSVLHGDKVAETRLTDLLMPAPLRGARDLTLIQRAPSAKNASNKSSTSPGSALRASFFSAGKRKRTSMSRGGRLRVSLPRDTCCRHDTTRMHRCRVRHSIVSLTRLLSWRRRKVCPSSIHGS
jgi:hypothetical protein